MTAIIRNDESCEMREMSLDELDQVAGGILPFLLGAAAGVVVVAAVAGTVFATVAAYEAVTGKHVSLVVN